jgi:deoxyribodipyrimidine photo-lyase
VSVLDRVADDPRVTIRRPGVPDPDGRCVLYWMQRAQRFSDNPALDLAIEAANERARRRLFGLVSSFRREPAPLPVLVEGLPDIAAAWRGAASASFFAAALNMA